MSRVYLGGPMRGIPKFNAPAFDIAAHVLRELGYGVVSPIDLDRKRGLDFSSPEISPEMLRKIIVDDVTALAECDELILLPGFEDSAGCAVEIATADFLGMPIREYVDVLKDEK